LTASSEFITEAQEVVETFSRCLLEIEGQLRDDPDGVDPDLVNASFRAVHTLKGLASMSGENDIVRLSHILESLLDALRLGKRSLDLGVLDVLFEAVEVFGHLLASSTEEGPSGIDIEPLLAKLEAVGQESSGSSDDALSWLDDSILGVLTEYEEHRLRENVRLGRKIFRVHASFDLLAIDVGIETLKSKLKSYGEVITYLPSADTSADDRIELDILIGSKAELADVAGGVGDTSVTIHELGGTGESMRGRALGVEDGLQPPESTIDTGVPAPIDPEPTPVPTPSAAPSSAGGGDAGGRGGDLGRGGEGDDGGEGGDGAPDVSLRSLSQTVRVDLRRLDSLMNLVGELGVVQSNLGVILERLGAVDVVSELHREFKDQVRVMTRKLALLQDGILDVRMVPLGQVFDKLARVVRKLSREAGKEVRLTISGADTELDKLIVEELSDPLMHMIRNAIDHGIENADERVSTGKQALGTIDLRAYQKGNRVVIEVQDDGRGMDWRGIRDTAVARGFLAADDAADLSPRQAINLIFTPGFSTRDTASELSGRGVGMDVVKTNIARLSGMIDVVSEPGRGSRFAITLPVTLAIIQALVIETAGQTFCIPLNSVLESVMAQTSDIITVEGHEVVTLRGKTLPLLHLDRIFELERDQGPNHSERLYVVVVGLAQHRVGLVVDELLGQQDVVIKPLGRALRQVPGIAGATELGANRTVLLLDVATLVAEAVGGTDAAAAGVSEHGI